MAATLKSRIGSVLIPFLPVNRRTFDILRHELRAMRTRAFNAVNPAFHWRVHDLRRREGLSLNIGSGGRGLRDWVNIELTRHRDTTVRLDVRRRLPFSDGSVRRILIEHVLEHVDFVSDAPAMLRDYHRLLEPGGVVRIIVPDAKRFAVAYVSGDVAAWRELGWDLARLPSDLVTPMHIVNHVFHQGGEHLFGYDFETLKVLLLAAGFERIERSSFRRSVDPELAIDQECHAPYSLYVEAVR